MKSEFTLVRIKASTLYIVLQLDNAYDFKSQGSPFNERLNAVQSGAIHDWNIIAAFSKSERINKKAVRPTEELTLRAAKDFLANLAEDEEQWEQLAFYSSLFNLVYSTDYLVLNGTGARGFSIIVEVTGKGNVSLCTLWSSKNVEFSLKR